MASSRGPRGVSSVGTVLVWKPGWGPVSEVNGGGGGRGERKGTRAFAASSPRIACECLEMRRSMFKTGQKIRVGSSSEEIITGQLAHYPSSGKRKSTPGRDDLPPLLWWLQQSRHRQTRGRAGT